MPFTGPLSDRKTLTGVTTGESYAKPPQRSILQHSDIKAEEKNKS